MNRVRCNVTLSEGRWQTTPTVLAVRNILGFYFSGQNDSLLTVEEQEHDPDAVLQVEVTVLTRWKHSEIVRDRIVEALLRRCQPEFESMVEVEVLDD